MALQYVGGTTGSGTGATYAVSLTSLAGGLAAAPATGDIVIVNFGYSGTGSTDANLAITGYTELADLFSDDTREINHYVGYKVMTATPDTSVTVTGSNSATSGGVCTVHVWRGQDATTPIDVTTTTVTAAAADNGNNTVPASITPVTSGAVIIVCIAGTTDSTPIAKTLPGTAEIRYAIQAQGTGSSQSALGGMWSTATHQIIGYNQFAWSGGESTTSDAATTATICLRPATPLSPLYQAIGTAVSATTGTLTVAWPTHATNDIALLFVESQANETALSTANGFVQVGSNVIATGTSLQVYWCRATSAAMASPIKAADSNHQYGVIATFRGCRTTGNPFTTYATLDKNAASTLNVTPSVTTNQPGELVVIGVTSDVDAATAFVTSVQNDNAITGIFMRFNAGTISGDGGGISLLTAGMPTTGSTGTTNVFVASSTSAMATIALSSIAAGTAPTVTLDTPADGAINQSTTPSLVYVGTDAESDTINYNVQVDTATGFNSAFVEDVLYDTYDYALGDAVRGMTNVATTYVTRIGQSFRGVTGGILSSVIFRTQKAGSPTGSVYAKLYAHTGTYGTTGTATGAALTTSAALDATDFQSTGFYGFDFTASPYTLVAGTAYVITIEHTGGNATDYISAVLDSTSPTHSGSFEDYNSNTSTWTANSTIDVVFWLYVKGTAAPMIDVTGITASSYDVSSIVQTYYIDGSDAAPTDPDANWLTESWGFDGLPSKFSRGEAASTTSSGFLKAEGTNAPAIGGTISQVRARVCGHVSSNTLNATIYTDSLGESLGNATVSAANSWGSYTTLSTPSGGWTWSKVQALETKVWITAIGPELFSKVEIEVTSTTLDDGITYYWRVAGIDPAGSGTYGAWSSTNDFTTSGGVAFAISGTTSNETTGTIRVAVNGTLQAQTGSFSAGTWTIAGVTKPASGDSITVFISDAASADISTAVTTYSGTGEITGMVLDKHVLSIGSTPSRSIVLSDLAKYDYDQDTTHILHSANGSPATLLMKFANGSSYVDEKLNILSGNTLTIGATETLSAFDVTIDGTMVASGAATLNITRNWVNNGTFTAGSSTVTLDGTATQALSGTLNSTSAFYNLTITNNSGASASDNERTGFTPSVDFNAAAKVTNNYTITTASVRVEYESAATYEFNNINWNGQATGTKIQFRNSTTSATWLLKVTGTQTAVSYVNVSRSDASVSGGTAISAFDGTNLNSGNNTSWTFVNTRVRQEINLINGSFASLSGSNATVGISNLDPGYGGTLSSYFEVVTTNTDSVSRIIYLRNWVGDTIISQITIPSGTSSPTRFRSSSFTFPVSAIGVYVNITGTTTAAQMTVTAARVIVIQNTGANPLTATETQIEIGNYESAKANTTVAPLTYPKYWYYNAARWSGTPAFYAEVSYASSTTNRAVTITLQKDNGGDFSFSDAVTIQSAAAATSGVPLLTSRVAFTPVEGCNYQIAAGVAGGTYSIYSAKIAVIQFDGGNVVKFEPQYLVANTYSGTTGLKNIDTSWDTTEWGGVSNTYYHEINSSTDTADSAKLQSDPNGTPIDVTGSTATGAYRARSTALTMPATNTLDTYILNTPIYASRIIVAVDLAPNVVLNTPSEAETVSSTPILNFTGTDPSSDALEYNVQIDTVNTFDSASGTGETLVDSYPSYNTVGTLPMCVATPYYTQIGQTFNANIGGIISSSAFQIGKNGTPTGTVVSKLYAHTGTFGTTGVPTGTALATSATVNVSSFSNGDIVSFSYATSPYTLVAGTKYAVVIEYTQAGSTQTNGISNYVDDTPTHAGSTIIWNNNASSWGAVNAYDTIFYVYVKGPYLSEFSATDAGFTSNHPFNSGSAVDYTVQSALGPDTYYWRVAAIDPSGSNIYGSWSATQSFVLDVPFTVSGTSDQTAGTASVAINGTLQGQTATIAGNGTWTINGVTKPTAGDAITVFVSSSSVFATAVTTYSGSGAIGGMVLNTHTLSIGSDQNRSIVLSDLANYDYDQDTTHILHSANGSPATLLMKFANGSSYVDEKINILAGNTLTIGATETLTTYDLAIASTGTLVGSGAATINVAHNWSNSGTFTAGSSTVTLNGTTQQTLSGTLSNASSFYNLTITNNSGATASDDERTGFTPGVIFSSTDATATNNYTITTSNVRVEYSSTHTYTFANINWAGTAGNLICFRNSVADTGAWSLKVTGTQTVSYVNVSRSTAIITGGGAAISAFDDTNTNAGSNTNWLFINTRFRQEINILDSSYSTSGDSGEIIYIDPAKYGGALTYKFEIVAMVTSGTGTVTLHDAANNVHATISVTATSFTKSIVVCSTAPTIDSYHINLAGGTGLTVQAARVIVLQDFGENAISAVETQIEIGDTETKANTTSAALDYPKYWLYTAANWDGTKTFYAEVAYKVVTTGSVTITLQKDAAGDLTTWSDVITVVNAQTQTVPTLSSRVTFTPTDGCNYRIAAYVSANNYTIYNAKIVVDQTGGSGLSGDISSISAPTYYIDATTAGEATNIFGVIETAQRGIFVKPDGYRGYFLTNTTQTLYQADFGTAWDMSTAAYNAAKLTISGMTSVYAPFFKPDGTKLYMLDDRTSTQDIYQYSVSTAWDLGSSVTADKNQALPGIGTELAVKDLYMTDDGTKAFVAGSTNSLIYAFSLSTAWDVATIAYVGSYSPSIAPVGIWFAPNGMKMYVASATTIYQYTLSTAWTITSGVTNDSISGSLADAGAIGLCFSPNMSKLYAGGATDDRWNEFNSGISYTAGVITVAEPQYLLQNTYKNVTGLQDYDISWATSDWQGVSNTYYHEIDLSSDTADSAKLQYDPNGTPTDVTGSSATGTAYRSRSSAMTMPVSQTIDTYISNVPIYASRIVVALQVPSVPTVTTPTATNVAIPNATLGATITSDGGMSITARGTCWGTSPSPTGNALAEGGTSTGAFSDARTGLSAGVIIYYRGYATNSKGTAYSEDGILIPGPNEEVQYDSDHETKIATGGSTTNTSVYLDFSTTAMNATEDVTPKVEVRAIGSAFTGTATHTGDAFNFSPDSSRMRNYPAVVYDAPNHRFVVFGGKDDAGTYLNDTWELKVPTSSRINPVWRQMSPTGTPPSARNAMVYVYDSVAHRMVIFGGTTATGLGGFFSLDLSSTDGAWSSFTPSGTVPTDRFTSAGIFDSLNRRMIVFGGYTTVDNNDTYSITLPDNLANSASTQLSPGGTIPTARSEHVAIFDSANQRMIVFGGWGAAFYNDVKSLSLTSGTEAWVAVTVNGSAPNVRSSHVAIYDSVNQRMVTGLGRYQAATVWYSLNDIYSLSIPTGNTFAWTDNTATAGSLPAKRHAAGAAYDSDNEKAIIFGGFDRTLSIISNETLSVDVSSSTGILYCREFNALTNLTPGDGSEAIYDSYNKHMVRFGGYGHIFDLANPDATGYHHAEVWAYCIDTNSSNYNYLNNITPSTGPLAGEVSAVVYDSNYRRLVRFGSLGYNQDQSLNDTWTMSLDPARSDYHVWVRLTTTGGPPGVRWGAATIFDPVNSRMIIFGGCDNGWTSTHYNDVWRLSLPDPDGSPTYTWTSVSAGTPPPARFQSTGIYDSTNIRMLIFGGRTSTPTYLNDLWELNWDNGTPDTFTWTDRTPSYTPALTGRRGHTTVYDSTYNRMIMFGGWDGATTHFDDVWSFDVSSLTVTATKITISGISPVVRRSHIAIFDPDGQRIIIQGGRGGLTPTNFLKDFWELTLPSGTSGWTWTELNSINYLKTSVSVPTLTNNTGYHWQAWSTGSVSGDTIKVSYGGNLESVSDFVVGTLSASTGIKVWNGTDWVYKPVKVYNGSTWVAKPVKVYDGADWIVKG